MLTKQMIAFKSTLFGLKVTNLNDIEIVSRIKRDLIHTRKRIENMKDVEEKKKALKVYVELLTSLEIGASDSLPPTR